MEEGNTTRFGRFIGRFMEIFGLSRIVAVMAVVSTGLLLLAAFIWFFHSAPPHTITITTGPPGSGFETNALKYAKILASNGITLKILPSEGSLQNLQRLSDPSFQVDIGFVQGGVTDGPTKLKIVSLGSISYQPLLVFYRGENPIEVLSGLSDKRLAIGPVGSGTRFLTLELLERNGIKSGGAAKLLDLEGAEAAQALLEGSADAAFLMGDSASPQVMLKLLQAPGIQILNFSQADAYTRKISYLNKLELPKGSIDFGKNIPAHDVYLIGPTVELLARPSLHPALCDLLLEAAQEVHGSASLLKRKGEFPAPLEHEHPISAEAARYYKSGKSFTYRYLPFRFASLVNRILVAFVPVVVLLIPAMKVVPSLFSLRIKLRIYRWYRALLLLERDALGPLTPGKRQELLERLDHIEQEVNKMKVPASFADQFYALRGHIRFVRDRLALGEPPAEHIEKLNRASKV
jgi:TRAP-type uncharacterized transport system substrate-binding protein